MLYAKIDRLAGKICLVEKITSKWHIFVCRNMGYLTLDGPGRQTVQTQSISVVPLKVYEYDGSWAKW